MYTAYGALVLLSLKIKVIEIDIPVESPYEISY